MFDQKSFSFSAHSSVWLSAIVAMAIIAFASITINIILLCTNVRKESSKSYSRSTPQKSKPIPDRSRTFHGSPTRATNDLFSSDSISSNGEPVKNNHTILPRQSEWADEVLLVSTDTSVPAGRSTGAEAAADEDDKETTFQSV